MHEQKATPVGMKRGASDRSLFFDPHHGLVAGQVPDPHAMRDRVVIPEEAAGAEDDASWTPGRRQPADLRVIGNAPDDALALLRTHGVELEILVEVHVHNVVVPLAEFPGRLDVGQGEGGDGLVPEPVEALRRMAELPAQPHRLGDRREGVEALARPTHEPRGAARAKFASQSCSRRWASAFLTRINCLLTSAFDRSSS